AASTAPPIAPPPLWRRAAPFVLTAVAAGAATGAVVRLTKPLAAPAPVVRFSVPMAEGFTAGTRRAIAMSPDGRQFVYVANRQLYLRELASTEARPIVVAQDGVILSPAFSPDGRSLVFYSVADHALKRIAVAGGVAVTVCPADPPFGTWWDERGIVFGQ